VIHWGRFSFGKGVRPREVATLDRYEKLCTYGGWKRGNHMRKRITMLITAAIMAMTMAFSAVPAFAVSPNGTTESFDNGICTTTTTKGANVTTTTHQGECNSSGEERGGGSGKQHPDVPA